MGTKANCDGAAGCVWGATAGTCGSTSVSQDAIKVCNSKTAISKAATNADCTGDGCTWSTAGLSNGNRQCTTQIAADTVGKQTACGGLAINTQASCSEYEGHSTCKCVKDAKIQTRSAGSNDRGVITGTTYGYGLKAHNINTPECSGANPADWCADRWCIVDPNDCEMKIRPVGYTTDRGDYFSYETAGNFNGNSWVGTQTCKDFANSYCTAEVNKAMTGNPECPCVFPATMQIRASGKPNYVQNSPYGYGCQAFDQFKKQKNSGSLSADDCSGDNPADWCADQWCVVDPNNCVFKARVVTYTTANDYSSYETCDTNFQGNSWVGTVACTDKPNSHCTAQENTDMIEGNPSCPCVLPAKAQTAAANQPSYVTGAPNQKILKPYAYGYGIKAHNDGKPECQTFLADGEKNDWCKDKWCIVDPNNCAMKIRPVGYTADRGDYFSYETANPNFNGNSWTGKVKCDDFANSYCTADVNTAMAGNPDCPCVLPAKMQTAATGKPAYVTNSPYGYGCQAFDQYKDGGTSGDCSGNNPADWCEDQWCVVDPNNCVFKAREVTYTTASDHSSYETCDTNFEGNSWVGTLACSDNSNSFCTAAENNGTNNSSDGAIQLAMSGAVTAMVLLGALTVL